MTAPGCHLCQEALATIERVRAETAFELEVVDVTGDPDLERRYLIDLPVVELDGERAFTYFVEADALLERLTRSG